MTSETLTQTDDTQKRTEPPLSTTNDVLGRWNERYAEMLNHTPATSSPDLDVAAQQATPDTDVSEDAPTSSEVLKVIGKLRNSKVAGSDNIPLEFLKYAEQPVASHYTLCFLTFRPLAGSQQTENSGVITCLYKGKSPEFNCSSYRAISLLLVPGKFFCTSPSCDTTAIPSTTKRTKHRASSLGDQRRRRRLLAELQPEFNRSLQTAYSSSSTAACLTWPK